MACSHIWSFETFTGLEVKNTGAYRVKVYYAVFSSLPFLLILPNFPWPTI